MDKYIEIVKSLLEHDNEDVAKIFMPINVNWYVYHHDNWNGGIDFYNIEIAVSIERFANLKKTGKIEEVQNIIGEAFGDATRADNSIRINEVILNPKLDKEEPIKVTTTDESSLWKLGYYRMFISHLTKDKEAASNLKTFLFDYGITGFVAHEDIEPTKEWQDEIEKGLATMDVLCAIVSPGFKESNWCDQEIGFALGRKCFIIPIRKGADPYGFIGKYQGIQSKGKKARKISEEIFNIICKNELSKNRYTKILADLFLNSKNQEEAEKWMNVLLKAPILDVNIVAHIHSHYFDNEVLNVDKIIGIANKLFTANSLNKIEFKQHILSSTNDDDLPF